MKHNKAVEFKTALHIYSQNTQYIRIYSLCCKSVLRTKDKIPLGFQISVHLAPLPFQVHLAQPLISQHQLIGTHLLVGLTQDLEVMEGMRTPPLLAGKISVRGS